MYPHATLDWSATRLEARLIDQPDEVSSRLELARICLSRGLFHGQPEVQLPLALQNAKRVLIDEPQSVEPLVIAGAALVAMGRAEAAQKYLDDATRAQPDRADLHLALGAMYRAQGDRHLSVRHLETAVRLSETSWEPHLLLGRVLAERARSSGEARDIERGQFHLVQALRLQPPADLLQPLMLDLGVTCLQTQRYAEAEKLFVRLKEHQKYAAVARKYLGQVAFALGKYKNAIQHYRSYCEAHGDEANVLAQMGLAYLHLRELTRAREHCNRALLLDPDHLGARHALACTLIEEGQVPEAMRVLRTTLADHPGDAPSYLEIARLRRRLQDYPWLQRALQTEVEGFDRLPITGGESAPRVITRKRIAVLLEELRAVGPSSIPTVLAAIDTLEDESLRFFLWEEACALVGGSVADDVASRLREPGKSYSVQLARNALAAAAWLPEPALTAGLNVTMEDIQRQTIERRGNQQDINGHRRAVEQEREVARAHQALLLLAIATRRSRSARQLLASWGKDADPDLQIAVLAAQVICGEPDAQRALLRRGQERGVANMVERLIAVVQPAGRIGAPQTVRNAGDVHCSSCGRTGAECTHLLSGTQSVLCDVCVQDIAKDRRGHMAPDTAICQLCGRTQMETRGVYRITRVDVCADCMDTSLGVIEREEVEKFLREW
ncbi:MAG: tetratricopeptide repeat protein [Myxococcales bacterium]|nr:tetratricopeptide repeat protein [Myxococcales bacterium]